MLRTLILDEDVDHQENVHEWPNHTASQAYAERARRLRAAGADAAFDRKNRAITIRRHVDGYLEIETLTFGETTDA